MPQQLRDHVLLAVSIRQTDAHHLAEMRGGKRTTRSVPIQHKKLTRFLRTVTPRSIATLPSQGQSQLDLTRRTGDLELAE